MTTTKTTEGASDMTDRVGFIGVGAMGSAIASRLVDTCTLYINDRNPAAGEKLVQQGAVFATAQEIVETCEVIFLSLPGPTNVSQLLLGEDGMAAQLPSGTVIVDTTTSTPVLDQEILDALSGRGVGFVDAPIGGGVRRAYEGTATLMVGGSPDDFAKVQELLERVTPNVFHVGNVGAGHAMKLVNNLLNSCNRFAALEAVRLGQAYGMDQDTVVNVLNMSTGRNYTTEYTFTQLLTGDTYKLQGFVLELMLKDVHLAIEMAASMNHRTPIGNLVEDLTREAIERFGPDADQSQLMAEWYEPTPSRT